MVGGKITIRRCEWQKSLSRRAPPSWNNKYPGISTNIDLIFIKVDTMARAPSKKKSPQEKKNPATKIAQNVTQLAWVWSQYKAKIEHDKSEIFKENNTLNQDQIKSDRTSDQISLSKEELISRNIRAMSTRTDHIISDRRGFNKVDKFIFGGIAILSLAAIVNY